MMIMMRRIGIVVHSRDDQRFSCCHSMQNDRGKHCDLETMKGECNVCRERHKLGVIDWSREMFVCVSLSLSLA